jgi:hypothetical protein
MRKGGKLMFWSGVLLPVFFVLSALASHPLPIILPLIIFFVGLSWMLYSRIFGEETASPQTQTIQPQRFANAPGNDALPPASGGWANVAGGQQVRTSELAQPRSVTENTTRLLDKE